MLKVELDIKNRQIGELNNRLAECQKLLDQQQQLNAISEQKNILPEPKKDDIESSNISILKFFSLFRR